MPRKTLRKILSLETTQALNESSLSVVLFDLDGTLADTAPDLAYALNVLLQEQGASPLPFEMIRPVVSNGASALLRLGFNIEREHEDFDTLLARFLAIYHANLSRETRLFPGMPELLDAIETSGMRWGVITNKPRWLTEPLITNLGLQQRAACIVSGDSTAFRKPHPEPMLHACHQIGVSPAQCLYVGDARRDIEAGRNAGMKTLVALFGYIDDSEQPQSWNADGMIGHPLEIFEWICESDPASER